MKLVLDLNRPEDYGLFLRIKALPKYRFTGREAWVPDEYAGALGVPVEAAPPAKYIPLPGLFDYQRDITALAIRKRKFGVFAEPGLGKTLILLEYARYVRSVLPRGRRVLIISPLMVVRQTLAEASRFYGKSLPIERVAAAQLPGWVDGQRLTGPECGGLINAIGITNYEAITDKVGQGKLGAIILDEGGLIRSHYGKWGRRIIDLGRGVQWKLSLTGTPAPNDRIEYANQAVFLDQFPTTNAFLARFFVNRGQTDDRWELKPHALKPFYRALSHWCIFLSNPAVYGWKDNVGNIPPIRVHIHDVPQTPEQWAAVAKLGGDLYGAPGGITSRTKLAQIAKGHCNGVKVETLKPTYIKALVDSWSAKESTIIWCRYNPEQEGLHALFPDAANVSGGTPLEEREQLIADFQGGRRRVLLTKPKILGLGLNLQVATRQVFSSCEDSYEQFWQGVKRSNRVGSTKPLDVHLPVTDIERPMMENVLRKAKRVQEDTECQERLFKEAGCAA